MSTHFLRRPIRRMFVVVLETGAASWAYKNRKRLMARFTKSSPPVPDTTRPLGDRFVAPVAGAAPTPFESAMAEEAAPITQAVREHEHGSTSHVRIDAVIS